MPRPSVCSGGRRPHLGALACANRPPPAAHAGSLFGGRDASMRVKTLFLALVSTQALHSAEEYRFRLYEIFPPAQFVSGLISQNLERGFVIANVALLAFGLACYLGPVRHEWDMAVPLAWLWVAIELVNGVGHPAWSLMQGHYTPGTITAVPLLVLAVALARQLLGSKRTRTPV